MEKILDGKVVKEELLKNIKSEINSLNEKLKLVVIRVGENPSSIIYVNSKKKTCEDNNILFEEIHYEENVSEIEIINRILSLNIDTSVTSILVQLPLPNHINAIKVLNTINYKKDVDGLTNENIGKLMNNEEAIEACTAKGIINLLKHYNVDLNGKNVTIINRSKLVGRPLIPLLLRENATITVCHSKTRNLALHTKTADIVIVAVGIPNFLTKDMVSENTIVIDVGINKVDGKTVGDADHSIYELVKSYSPVPGGIGIMTVSSVVTNVLECYKLSKKNM